MIQDIPKLYTALAEWLACVLFVRLLPQRYNAAKTAGILAAALPLFGLVQWLIGIVPLSLWIPGMIVALVLMYATIWLCCRLNFCDTGFWWALAFTLVMIHNGFSILLGPASFVLPNALRAANDVRYTMVVATISMLVWRMGLSWVLCVNMGMGAVGVWYAMLVDWVCRVICFIARFATGAWKKNAVKKV